METRDRNPVAFVIMLIVILVMTSWTPIVSSLNAEPGNIIVEGSQTVYVPRYPSMLKVWNTIPIGKNAFKPVAHGRYIAVAMAKSENPTSVVISVYDIVSGNNLVYLSVNIPIYVYSKGGILKDIELNWFSWQTLGENVLGIVLVLYYNGDSEYSHIISVPDIFGKVIGSVAYNIPILGTVKGYTIVGHVMYVLESNEIGVYSLRALNLKNGEVLWIFRDSEFTVPDWKLITKHLRNFSSISGQKNPQDLYYNYTVIYKPLFEALYRLKHTVLYARGKLYVFLPFGPILIVNASNGKGINDDEILAPYYALSPDPNEGLQRDILYPIGCEYKSSSDNEVGYIVAFYIGTNYAGIIKKYLENNTGLSLGKLVSEPKVIVYSTDTQNLDPSNDSNALIIESNDVLSTSVLIVDPLVSFYIKKYSLSIITAQVLYYNYTWLFDTEQYINNSEKDIEDRILDLKFDVIDMVSKSMFYVISGISPKMLEKSQLPLPTSHYIKDTVHFKALTYALPYYLSNESIMPINFTDLVLVVTDSGLYAYGIRYSTEGNKAEPALIWCWEKSVPIGLVPIENVLWALYEKVNDEYKLVIVSPVYIKAGDPVIGYYNMTLNVLYAGFSFYDYLSGEWDPYLPRHLLASIYYITPSGNVYSLKANTTILLDYPGINTIRAVLYFDNNTVTSSEELSHERLTEILLHDSVADEAFFDVYVLSKNYWPSRYGGIEGYNYAYATLPRIDMLGVMDIPGIQNGAQNIVSLQTLNTKIYVVTTDGLSTKVYTLSPSLAVIGVTKLPGKALSSVIFRNKLYVLSKEGNFNCALYELSDGGVKILSRLLWPSESTILSVSPSGIYIIDKEQGIIAKTDEYGKVLWTRRLFSRVNSFSYGFGAVYVYTADGKVYAIDDSSGIVTWYIDIGAPGELLYVLIPKSESTYGWSYVLIITEDGIAYALSPEDGRLIRVRNVFMYSNYIEKLIGDIAYVPTKSTVYFVTNYAVYALDPRTLEAHMIMPITEEYSNRDSTMILATDDRITILFSNGNIVVIDLDENGYTYKTLNTGVQDIQDIAVAEPFIVFANRTGVFAIGIQPIQIVAAYPETLTAKVGENITMVLKVYDLYGNPLPGVTLNVTKPSGLVVVPQNIITDENGTATITFTTYTAGVYPIEISAYIEGKTFSIERTLVFVHAEPTMIEINISPEEITAGEYATVTVKVYDEYGNPVPGVTLEAAAVYGAISPQTTKTDPTGKATFVYTSKIAGSDSITIRAPDYGISAAKVVKVNPGPPYKVVINAPSEISLGETFMAEIVVYDMYNNPVLPGYQLNVYVDDILVDTISTGTGGRAVFQYKFTDFGTYTIRVEWKDNPSVYDVTVVSVVSGVPAAITIESITSEITAGEYLEATILVYDKYNNPAPGVSLDVYVDNIAIGTFTTNSEGKVYVRVQMTEAGTHVLRVEIAGMPSIYKEATFTVNPSDQIKLSVTLNKKEFVAGENITLTMFITDIYGNPVTKSLRVIIGSSSEYVLVSSEPTKYSITVTKAGKIPVMVEYNGEVLFEDETTVYPGEPNKILSNASITVRAGEQFSLVIQVFDNYGNPVPGVSVTVRDISGVAPSYTKTIRTDEEGIAVLKDTITLAQDYKLEVFVTEKHEVKFIVDLTVLPSVVSKVIYVGPDVIYAGEYANVVLLALDSYANPIYNVDYVIEAPKDLTIKQMLTRTTGNGSILFTVYTEKAGKYTVKVTFPNYNKTFEVELEVTPSLDRTVILELDKTNVKPGEDVTVTFVIKDRFGNPVVDELPRIRIRGVQVLIKTLLPTDASGTGIVVFTPQEKGFGSIWAEYMNKQTEPIEFVSGNPTLLKITNFVRTYWYVLVIVGIVAVIAGLFVAYLRTIGRMRRMI